MAQLPPPRLPGQPPDRPPIRRPGDHLPLPDQLGPAEPTATSGGSKRTRVLVGIAVLALTMALAIGALLVLGGDDGLNTKAAAETIDEALRNADDEPDCPIDDVPALLARAVDPIGTDALYDVIDLGDPANLTIESDDGPSTLVCSFFAPDAQRDAQIEGVGLALSVAPDDYVRYSEERADSNGDETEIDELGAFQGGTVYHQTVTTEDETFVEVSWVDDDVVIGVLISSEDVGRFDTEDLERGLAVIVPSVVGELAGERTDD